MTDDPCIMVCQGPPRCLLEDDEAVEAQRQGCIWCKRVTVHDDGAETVRQPSDDRRMA